MVLSSLAVSKRARATSGMRFALISKSSLVIERFEVRRLIGAKIRADSMDWRFTPPEADWGLVTETWTGLPWAFRINKNGPFG